jgi:hypothetical protein
MRWRRGLVLLAVVVPLLLSARWAGAADRCNVTADTLLFKVKSWADLHRWFRDYADCDDGNLADDVSEYVTSSLAKDWKDFPRLEQEIKHEPRFKEFVLHHIDTTTDTDDLEAVRRNATERCPAGSADLCASIAGAAQSTLKESRQPS